MTKRETALLVAFIVGFGGLLLSDSGGRALLAAPVTLAVNAPRWAVWSVALLAYGTSLLLPWRPLRVGVGLLLMHAFIPVQPLNPLLWTTLQEACLLALVALLDFNIFGRVTDMPNRPKRGPAVALRQAVLGSTAAINERRRAGRT